MIGQMEAEIDGIVCELTEILIWVWVEEMVIWMEMLVVDVYLGLE